MVHGLFILAAILALAPLLAYIPMASMAALLIMVAWNMSEARHFVRTLRIAPRQDVITLLTCFSLTVLFDMVIAVAVGMGLAAVLFIRRSIALTGVDIRGAYKEEEGEAQGLAKGLVVYDINGPLFFGSAQKAMRHISMVSPEVRVVILDMSDVTMLDMTAIVSMESIVKELQARRIGLIINNLQPRMILKLRRAGVRKRIGAIAFSRSLDEALTMYERKFPAA